MEKVCTIKFIFREIIVSGWRPYPNCHAKGQFDVKLYTRLPTLANVERGNPQNYDAFKKTRIIYTSFCHSITYPNPIMSTLSS